MYEILDQTFLNNIKYEFAVYARPHPKYNCKDRLEYTKEQFENLENIYLQSLETFHNLDNITFHFFRCLSDYKSCIQFYSNHLLMEKQKKESKNAELSECGT